MFVTNITERLCPTSYSALVWSLDSNVWVNQGRTTLQLLFLYSSLRIVIVNRRAHLIGLRTQIMRQIFVHLTLHNWMLHNVVGLNYFIFFS